MPNQRQHPWIRVEDWNNLILDQIEADNPFIIRGEANPLGKKPAGVDFVPETPNGPELWDKILEGVREIYEPEYVCVAGGAVRDYKLKQQPKDIDVFVKMKEDWHPNQLLDEAGSLGWKGVNLKGNADYEKIPDPKIVLNGWVFEYNVDLIFQSKATGQGIVEGFDFGICQHWYDGELHSTVAGAYGLNKKLWEVTPGFELDAVLREHFNRVNERHGKIYRLKEDKEPWYVQFNKYHNEKRKPE